MPDDLEQIHQTCVDADLTASAWDTLNLVQTGRYQGYPYITVNSGDPSVGLWQTLRSAFHGNRYPVIVYAAEGLEQTSTCSIQETIDRSLSIGENWVRRQADHIDKWSKSEPRVSSMNYLHRAWPEKPVARHDFVGPRHGGFFPQPTVDILLLPCSEPWMAPAYIFAYGHNDRPEAEVQCAILRSWQNRFGAELVYTNGPVYEFAVGRPAETRESALELAREHFLFCPDRLHQSGPDDHAGYETPDGWEGLAAMLMVSTVWYFWWD